MSTAEVLSVIQTGLQSALHLGNGVMTASDLGPSLKSTVIKDLKQDLPAWKEYVETVVKNRAGWKNWYEVLSED